MLAPRLHAQNLIYNFKNFVELFPAEKKNLTSSCDICINHFTVIKMIKTTKQVKHNSPE
jgi:hypothetical protein